MEITRTLYVTDRAEWRRWLQSHYSTESEIWLIYYKKHSGRPRIPYDEAVEEALCFGWIDGIVKRIDEEKFAQRFTPRKKNSQWSDLNRARVKKLIEEGRMTEAGLATISEAVLKGDGSNQKREKDYSIEVPAYFQKALNANKAARENFNKMARSYRRDYVKWVAAAKREETRERRIREAIELLSQNKKLGMK